MHIFVGWSGERSKRLASILRDWLPIVLPPVNVYFSVGDTAKGGVWYAEMMRELETSRLGLLILTPENRHSPWLHFEAGVLTKNIGTSRVCPLMFGVDASDLSDPFRHFQVASFGRTEMKRVVSTVNALLSDLALDKVTLESAFDARWPGLENAIQNAMEEEALTPRRLIEIGNDEVVYRMLGPIIKTYAALLRSLEDVHDENIRRLSKEVGLRLVDIAKNGPESLERYTQVLALRL